jgi:hypothetical protein
VTNNTTQILVIGILFVIIGLCTIRFKKQRKLVGLIPLILGLTAVALTTFGPLAQSQKQIDKILKVDKTEIVRISIKPTTYKGHEEISLTKTTIEITKTETIDSLCTALTNAKSVSTIMKNPKWTCLVRLDKKDNSYIQFVVKGAGQNAILEVNSNGDYGWNYGAIEALSFGQILTTLTK